MEFTNAPHDTTCRELEGRPVRFDGQFRPIAVDNRVDRTDGLRLLQIGSEAIHGGVTVHANWRKPPSSAFQQGNTKAWGETKLAGREGTTISISAVNSKLTLLLRRDMTSRMRRAIFEKERPIVYETAEETLERLEVSMHRHLIKSDRPAGVRAHTVCEEGVAQDINGDGVDKGLGGGGAI